MQLRLPKQPKFRIFGKADIVLGKEIFEIERKINKYLLSFNLVQPKTSFSINLIFKTCGW